MTTQEAYKQGFIDGLTAFAWWKDGVEYLGTSGTRLKDTIANVEKVFSFRPPSCVCESERLGVDACPVHNTTR